MPGTPYDMKNILFTTALLLCLSTANASGGSPSETVQAYCQKDFDGVRLSSKTWQQVVPLITWEHEQGWDVVTGISEFKITSEEISGDSAKVQVQFLNKSGSLDESIIVQLRNKSGQWKIIPPMYQPHVSQDLLCEKFNRCDLE